MLSHLKSKTVIAKVFFKNTNNLNETKNKFHMSHFMEKSSDVVLFLKTEFSLELPIEEEDLES